MEEIVVYVHGKGGSAQEAEHYKALFPNCEVIGFDYHAQSPWEATEEFSGFFTAVRKRGLLSGSVRSGQRKKPRAARLGTAGGAAAEQIGIGKYYMIIV